VVAGQLALLTAGERRQGEGERNKGGAGTDGSRRQGAAWWGRRACHPYVVAGKRRPCGGRLLPRSTERARAGRWTREETGRLAQEASNTFITSDMSHYSSLDKRGQ
jgi:hypothetical protein